MQLASPQEPRVQVDCFSVEGRDLDLDVDRR